LRNINVKPKFLVRRIRKNLATDMQRTRLKLLNDLETMFDMAKGYATSRDTKDKQRQIWIRIMTYIGQVINSISKSFDEAVATKDLERLERMIHEAMAKEEDRGADKRSSRPNSGKET
jgi:ArsR family metal-binding transcriptional regulator